MIEAATVSMIQTSHPYENNMRKLWHYKSGRPHGQRSSARKRLHERIQRVDNRDQQRNFRQKITATEKANVNTKFDAYNAALADLKETIEAAGVDVAAVAAAAVAEYARAAIKVEADKIELRVTSAQAES